MPLNVRVYSATHLSYQFPGGDKVGLGFSKEGFTVSFKHEYEDVLADPYGSKVPIDVQFMGATAEVKGTLVAYSAAAVQALLSGSLSTQVGGLSRLGGGMVEVFLDTGAIEAAYFSRAILIEPVKFTLGTKASTLDISFKAFPGDYGVTSWYRLTT